MIVLTLGSPAAGKAAPENGTQPEFPRYSAPAQSREDIVEDEMRREETNSKQEADGNGCEKRDQGQAQRKKIQE